MSDVPTDFYEDGEVEEEYKILRESEVDCQHIIADPDGTGHVYRVYRPCCHGNLPMFIKGNHRQRDPAVQDDVLSAMTGGVIEGPVEGDVDLGDTVYVAYLGATDAWYLTVDAADTNIECCFGIIIDDQRPIHYGEAAPPDDLFSIRIVGPGCGSLDERQ